MDIYKLYRNLWDFAFANPEKLKPNDIAIYSFAIEHCNRLGWKKKFGFPTSMVMEATGIKSYSVYKKHFDNLIENNFFEIIEYSKNQYSSNIIALKENCKANDKAHNKALDKALIKHTTKQSESTIQSIDSIDKQVTKNNDVVDMPATTSDFPNVDLPKKVEFSKNTIRYHYENFMLKESSQKNNLCMTKQKSKKEIEILCIGYVISLLESGETMDSYKPDFARHFFNWINSYGLKNSHMIDKTQIQAQFKKLNLYQDDATN